MFLWIMKMISRNILQRFELLVTIIKLAKPLLKRSSVVKENKISKDRTSTGVFLGTDKHPI